MFPQSHHSYCFSTRCLAVGALGALHQVDPLGGVRALSDRAGINSAISPGLGTPGVQFSFFEAAAEASRPDGGAFRTFQRWALGLLERSPKLMPSKATG